MRDRLMVGHAPLEGGIMVRVHVPQPIQTKRTRTKKIYYPKIETPINRNWLMGVFMLELQL